MSPVLPQFERLEPWPQPPSPPIEPIPPIKVSGKAMSIIAVGEVLSIIFIPGIGWVPYGARLAFGAVSALIYLGDDKGKSHKEALSKYNSDLKDWNARQKFPDTLKASNNVELTRIVHQFRSGEIPPLTEIHLEGSFGQAIKRSYKTWYRTGTASQLREWKLAADILEASVDFAKAKSGNIISAGKVLKILVDFYEVNDSKFAKFWDCVAEESSDIIREFLFNGVNLVSEKDGKIILRWGPRLEKDYALGPDPRIIEGEVVRNALQ